jgi:hypothetical protein
MRHTAFAEGACLLCLARVAADLVLDAHRNEEHHVSRLQPRLQPEELLLQAVPGQFAGSAADTSALLPHTMRHILHTELMEALRL